MREREGGVLSAYFPNTQWTWLVSREAHSVYETAKTAKRERECLTTTMSVCVRQKGRERKREREDLPGERGWRGISCAYESNPLGD